MTLGNMRELGVHHLIGYCAGPCLPIRIPAPAAGPIRPDWLGMLAPGMPGRSPHRGDGGGQDAAQSSPTASTTNPPMGRWATPWTISWP